MNFEELYKQFLSVPDKNSFMYKSTLPTGKEGRNVCLAKVQITDRIEYLYMAKQYNTENQCRICMNIGANLLFIGLIVDHKTLIFNRFWDSLWLSDEPKAENFNDYYEKVRGVLRAAAVSAVEGEKRPELNADQLLRARNDAFYAVLHQEPLVPDCNNFIASCNVSEIIVSYLEDFPGWKEKLVQKWLSEPGNKECLLVNVAVYEKAVSYIDEWIRNPKSDANIYASMVKAVQNHNLVRVKCGKPNGESESYMVQTFVFLNEYGKGYDVIPAFSKINEFGTAEHFVFSKRGDSKRFLNKKDISMILTSTGDRVLWVKGIGNVD